MTPGMSTTACFFLSPRSASALPTLKSLFCIHARGALKLVRLANVAEKLLKSFMPLSKSAESWSGMLFRCSRDIDGSCMSS